MNAKTGDLIGVSATPNTHGCQNYAILRCLGNNKAEVVEAQSCSSCWQVGHDGDYTFATIGDVWNLDQLAANDGEEFSTDVKWTTE